jgi:hypothetical protein
MPQGTMKSQWKVHFHPVTGDHQSFPQSVYQGSGKPSLPPVERPAHFTFTADLTYVDYEKGRSAVGFLFKDKRGVKYRMFLSEFHRLLPDMIQGRISGTWGFEKRGGDTGLVRVDAPPQLPLTLPRPAWDCGCPPFGTCNNTACPRAVTVTS